MKLYIGNKNYSSWSMRPWVLLKQAEIAFDEVMLRFDDFNNQTTYEQSPFKQSLRAITPVGKVPVLVDGDLVVWDTLAIAEYVAEQFPEKQLWPQDKRARARARSLCAEMHSGFTALRGACPMNIEARLPDTGALIWRDNDGVRAEVARLCTMWQQCLNDSGGPLLFGQFSVADAYFAPICTRLLTYALPLPEVIVAYVHRVCALPGVAAWLDEARAEADFLDFEEPYRLHR